MFKKIIDKFNKKLTRSFNQKLDITKEELQQYEKDGAIIIDVRSPQEYNEGHVNGSICIPEYDIKKKVDNILKNKNDNIVVYCSTGQRSKKAQEKLKKMGYNNVYNVYGGIEI